jgi:hypothetical protein
MVVRWALWANLGTVAAGTVAVMRLLRLKSPPSIKGGGEVFIRQARNRK